MNEQPERPSGLSPAGEARRWMILASAVREAGRLRRRRRVRRTALAAGLPCAAIVALAYAAQHWLVRPTPSFVALPSTVPAVTAQTDETRVAHPADTPHALATARPSRAVGDDRAAVIRVVGDDPTVSARFRAPAIGSRIKRIDDAALIRTLDASGMQAGVAMVGDQTVLFVDGRAVR